MIMRAYQNESNESSQQSASLNYLIGKEKKINDTRNREQERYGSLDNSFLFSDTRTSTSSYNQLP